MQKQAAKTRVFTQESLTELQDKMHKYAEQEMNEHPEIFEGENLKEIEKGRNSDWSKEFFVRKKAEALESLNEQYAATTNAVEVNETVLEELNKQTEETIQTMVETEAQKEFMRYAFLKEPKTPIGKLVAGAWRKFKEWWDMHKRKEVEEKTRESVLGRLAELKKETKEHPRTPGCTQKTQGNRVRITFTLIDSDGGVTRSRYMSSKQEVCKIIWTNAKQNIWTFCCVHDIITEYMRGGFRWLLDLKVKPLSLSLLPEKRMRL